MLNQNNCSAGAKPGEIDVFTFNETITCVGPPAEVELLVTRRCNLKCPHCCAKALEDDLKELTTDQWLSIVEQLADLGCLTIALTGGEPTLRPDLLTIVDRIINLGMPCSIASNGANITEEFAEQLSNYGKEISVHISVDGPRDKHDHFRGVPGAFDTAIGAIRILSKAGVPVKANFMVTTESINWFMETAEIVVEAGASGITVGQLAPVGRSPESAIISYPLWTKFVREVTDKMKQGKIQFNVRGMWHGGWQTYLPLLDRIEDAYHPRLWGKMPEITPECGTCIAGVHTAAIDSEGWLYPCDLMSSFPELRCGNVIEHGVADVWQRSLLLTYLRQIKTDDISPCKSCPIKPICLSGCRSSVYGLTKSLAAPDIRCPLVTKWLERQEKISWPLVPNIANKLYSQFPENASEVGAEQLKIFGVIRKFIRYSLCVLGKHPNPGNTFVIINQMGYLMLKEIAQGLTINQIGTKFAKQYNVEFQRIIRDLVSLLKKLVNFKFLPEENVRNYIAEVDNFFENDESDNLSPLIVKEVGEKYLVYSSRKSQVVLCNYTSLFIMRCIAEGKTFEETIQEMMKSFEINDKEQVVQDVNEFWTKAKEFSIIGGDK
ncbi:hypothetical protein BBF96_10320 [Anoxybacter fermentans]|uniref:Radical SAM core domain-containing protein n=1 Tax=Anoxybacter fermentans TaxID=1323375 RepID=A0A3Q9HSX4_9FIRM|nr:PqqD family peptide modification chaperone [Anoxybacter fermentans]AZR73745.1 hypothetical protein BBF96_10320 [Anoxybacter fermentans]